MFEYCIIVFHLLTMNLHKFVLLTFSLISLSDLCNGQEVKPFIKEKINVLASPSFHGRGYVMNGGDKAAGYIADEFKKYGVLPIRQNGSYFQDYKFSVNTFPNKVIVKVNNETLKPGTRLYS